MTLAESTISCLDIDTARVTGDTFSLNKGNISTRFKKKIGERLGMKRGGRIIIRAFGSDIVLIPVNIYEKPTRALHGSVRLLKSVDKPKELARSYMSKKLEAEFV